jgi:heptaprenylglyceryl phosphate synthase
MTAEQAVFKAILNAKDGDYILQAQLLAAMKPNGW